MLDRAIEAASDPDAQARARAAACVEEHIRPSGPKIAIDREDRSMNYKPHMGHM